jgi:hypothetical protein
MGYGLLCRCLGVTSLCMCDRIRTGLSEHKPDKSLASLKLTKPISPQSPQPASGPIATAGGVALPCGKVAIFGAVRR